VQQYVSLLRAAYPGFKAGDPAAKVILGGPASNDDGWIGQVYSLGGKDSFDVLSTHPYQGVADAPPEHPDDGDRWWFTHLPAVRNVMIANGDGAKPVWFTEFGWSNHTNGPNVDFHIHPSERDQLARAHRQPPPAHPLLELFVRPFLTPSRKLAPSRNAVPQAFARPPLHARANHVHRVAFVLVARRRPRVIGRPDVARLRAQQR
jgi:hypothetical protein